MTLIDLSRISRSRHRTSEQHHSIWCRHQRSTDGNRSRQLHPDSVHQSTVCTSCSSLPACHGIPDQSLKDVFQATVLAKITYCLPAWSGLYTAADRIRLNSSLRWCMKLGYYSFKDPPTISSIADDVEDTLFKSILRNGQHVLQPYLEERPQLHCNLRNRPGINKTLIEKTVDLSDRFFSSQFV